MQTVSSMQQARIAIRAGHLAEARRLMRQLVRDDPQNHVAWLLLARATPSPQAAMEYVKRAETVQPGSPLVQRELLRLSKKGPAAGVPSQRPPWRTYLLLSSSLIVLLLLAIWLAPLEWDRVAALRGTSSTLTVAPLATISPVATNSHVILVVTDEPILQPAPTRRSGTSQTAPIVESSIGESTVAVIAAEDGNVATVLDSEPNSAQDAATDSALAEVPSGEEITDVAVVEVPEIIEVAPAAESSGIRPNGVGEAERWVDVNLNTQTLVAYEGNTPVFNSLISSGMWDTPTITGQYRTWMKYESQDMNGYLLGYDYYLEDVPYVMYFFKDYAIHGAYWHNSFGSPMSHGCVNMNPVDAGWLYNWAPVGTTVNIHN